MKEMKELKVENVHKYQDLVREFRKVWKSSMTVIFIVVRATDLPMNDVDGRVLHCIFLHFLQSSFPKFQLLDLAALLYKLGEVFFELATILLQKLRIIYLAAL